MSLPKNRAARAARDARFTATILRARPFQVLLQVTNRCNMRCSFCDFWPNGVAPRDELDLATYQRLARELAQLGTFLVSIEGGEPLVRPDLPDIVEALAERHIPALFTNGWYVEDDTARELWARGLVHASVSIDYPTAPRHDEKRDVAGAFARAVRAVERLGRHAPNGGRQVNVMSVVMEDNADDLDALCRLSQRLGVGHQLTLLSVSGYRRKGGRDRLPPPEVAEKLAELHDHYPHVRFFRSYFEGLGPFLRGGPMPTCQAGVQSFNIDHVGNVSPCIERIDHAVGNVRLETLATLHAKLVAQVEESRACRACWTACRGVTEALGNGSDPRALRTLATRMRPLGPAPERRKPRTPILSLRAAVSSLRCPPSFSRAPLQVPRAPLSLRSPRPHPSSLPPRALNSVRGLLASESPHCDRGALYSSSRRPRRARAASSTSIARSIPTIRSAVSTMRRSPSPA